MTKTEKILRAYLENPKMNKAQFARENNMNRTFVTDTLRTAKISSGEEIERMINELAKKRGATGIVDRMFGADPDIDGTVASIEDNIDTMNIKTDGKNIRSADGAMEYCGVNPDEWDITKKIVNFWDMGKHRNWQVKVWLKRRSELTAEAAIGRLIDRIGKFKYSKFKPAMVSKRKSGNLGLLANFDAHLGKLAWDIETGQGDYDIDIAVGEFDHVTDTNLNRIALFNPEKIIIIIGEDMLHYENLEGVTPKGRNILDTDGRLGKLQDAAIDAIVRTVYKARALAPVEVILVQGNHDETSSLWLSKVIRAYFKDDKFVDVDCQPRLRKARLWGKVFLGFGHKIMPTKIPAAHAEFSTSKDTKDLWGKAEYREVLFGDQHKKMQWKVGSLITHGATIFRQLTALSKIDYWHYENLFTDAVPGGEAFVYNKDTGFVANFIEWTYHLKNK